MSFENAKETEDAIRRALPPDAALVSFDRNDAFFGNMTVVIKQGSKKHTFCTDRGEILHGKKLLCNSAYHQAGQDDTFPMLLQMIQKELK